MLAEAARLDDRVGIALALPDRVEHFLRELAGDGVIGDACDQARELLRRDRAGVDFEPRLVERTGKIAQKVGEEAVEALIEAVRGDKKALTEESADLMYHLLVLWADSKVKASDVWCILEERFDSSGGIDEKKAWLKD